jgi:tRNA U34 5-methylaminomethyl-2-thiouridine-forming methyltransferase MnmC
MSRLELIATGDGSHSVLNVDLQETYHSRHGALQESRYVFIEKGLLYVAQKRPGMPIRIFEMGFGTGLNAGLSLMEGQEGQIAIRYESWEKEPLPETIVSQLNYADLVGADEPFNAVHRAAWDREVEIAPGFTLMKRRGDVLTDALTGEFDLIYYDAFAPSKQPKLWTLDALRRTTERLSPGGVWVTYCAKGQVKRDLAELGLSVETLPGPPGKKEMTRASRVN